MEKTCCPSRSNRRRHEREHMWEANRDKRTICLKCGREEMSRGATTARTSLIEVLATGRVTPRQFRPLPGAARDRVGGPLETVAMPALYPVRESQRVSAPGPLARPHPLGRARKSAPRPIDAQDIVLPTTAEPTPPSPSSGQSAPLNLGPRTRSAAGRPAGAAAHIRLPRFRFATDSQP